MDLWDLGSTNQVSNEVVEKVMLATAAMRNAKRFIVNLLVSQVGELVGLI